MFDSDVNKLNVSQQPLLGMEGERNTGVRTASEAHSFTILFLTLFWGIVFSDMEQNLFQSPKKPIVTTFAHFLIFLLEWGISGALALPFSHTSPPCLLH